MVLVNVYCFAGLYDMTMLRFSPNQRVGEYLYQRGDGTLSYFFSLEVLRDLFTREGFIEVKLILLVSCKLWSVENKVHLFCYKLVL
jgi:hypothetical protein